MKKVFASVLSVVTILMVTACGGQGDAIPEPGDPDFIGPVLEEMIED